MHLSIQEKEKSNIISLYKSNQGSKDKTLVNKLKYIPNDYTWTCPFCRLQLEVEMFGTQPTK